MAYVYLITNKINGKKYIGSSRKNQIDENYYGSGKAIKDALKKYGKNNFQRDILWEGKGNARKIETYFLEGVNAANNPLYYNMTNDARGNNIHKEETKKTVSEKLTGRKFSKEICEKISKAKQGSTTSKKGKPDGPKPKVSNLQLVNKSFHDNSPFSKRLIISIVMSAFPSLTRNNGLVILPASLQMRISIIL